MLYYYTNLNLKSTPRLGLNLFTHTILVCYWLSWWCFWTSEFLQIIMSPYSFFDLLMLVIRKDNFLMTFIWHLYYDDTINITWKLESVLQEMELKNETYIFVKNSFSKDISSSNLIACHHKTDIVILLSILYFNALI